MTNTPGGGAAIVQYAQGQDGQFFVPGWLRKKQQQQQKKQYFTYYPVFVFPFNPYLFRLNISNPTSCHTNSHSFNSLSLSFFLSVCVTGDLQAYAVRNVTTTAGLNSTGVVVGSGTGQSLQVPKRI